jgi:hypothetical protein
MAEGILIPGGLRNPIPVSEKEDEKKGLKMK